jgi:hypothetical protein
MSLDGPGKTTIVGTANLSQHLTADAISFSKSNPPCGTLELLVTIYLENNFAQGLAVFMKP